LNRMSDTLKTLTIGLNVPDDRRRDPGISKLPGIDALNILTHRPRVDERVMVHNRDAVVHPSIDVGNVGDFVYGVVVVNVCDLHHADASIGHVHILNVARASSVPRNVNFTWS
jgi:hypothetical protein